MREHDQAELGGGVEERQDGVVGGIESPAASGAA
jgi:hypothetical protein